MAALSVLCLSAAAFSPSLPSLPSLHRPAVTRASVSVVLPPEFNTMTAEMFSDGASAADVAATAGDGSPMADILITLAVCAVAAKLVGGGLGDVGDVAPADQADPKKSRMDKFGWIHADLRVPLPELASLRTACHLIGQHNGHDMYLCGNPQPQGSTLSLCELSEDVSGPQALEHCSRSMGTDSHVPAPSARSSPAFTAAMFGCAAGR